MATKILKLEEINRKKGQHVTYSESYEVAFQIKNGEFWVRKIEMYFSSKKGDADAVISRWQNDYKGQDVTFVSVNYQ